jgi:hypothetical protein
MKPYIHAVLSQKKYGGQIEDYMPIHNFMDSTKSALADVRHRAILHSAFGVYIVEKVFGNTFKNSDEKIVSTRDIAEEHILQDLGTIPTLDKWFRNMPIEDWMTGRRKIKSITELKIETAVVA